MTRRVDIDGKTLVVMDGLFRDEDVASLFTLLKQSPYRLNDSDSDESAHVLHWKAEFPIAMAQGLPILRECVRLTEDFQPGLTLNRVHANLELYGDMLFPHTDTDDGVTCLYYANPVWERNWQGETIFYDSEGEPLYAVAPRPGRIAIFDGDIIHRVGVPSRECYQPRITVAFKFSRGARQ